MKNELFKRFDSVLDFAKYLDNAETQPAFKDSETSQDQNTSDWAGTNDYQTARDLLLYGDPDSAERVNAAGLRHTIKQLQGRAPRTKLFTDIVGGVPCVPNYIIGRPDSMYNTQRTTTPKPVINIVYNCSVAGSVSRDTIDTAAAALLGAVVILENSGARVNLYVCDVSRDNKDTQIFGAVVRVKPADQKVNLRKIAYCICNTAFERRQMFRFTEVTKGIARNVSHNYGRPEYNPDRVNKTLTAAGVRPDIVYNVNTARDKSAKTIADEIANAIKRK